MQNYSNSIWAMSQLKYDCPKLVKAFALRAEEDVAAGSVERCFRGRLPWLL